MKPALITPKDFELRVKRYIELSAGGRLEDFSVVHRDHLSSPDGNYEIDITARFRALQVTFLILIECKYYSHPIKRDIIQILYAKIESTGAQKGILFSVSPFQKGAILYAKRHGIALAKLTDAGPTFETRAAEEAAPARDLKLYIPTVAPDGSIVYDPRAISYLSTYLSTS
ncbi:MAG: restriction endonuclease [Thermoanaerobaculia bacterium]